MRIIAADNIDHEVVAQLTEDLQPGDLRHLLRVFEDDVRRLTDALSAAAVAGTADAWHAAAHGLAGSAGAVGAARLERAAREAMSRPGFGDRPPDEEIMSLRSLGHDAVRDLSRMLAHAAGDAC